MAIVTTYVCDVSGKTSSEKAEFVSVEICSNPFRKNEYSSSGYSAGETKKIGKLVHIDVANKLGLIEPPKDKPAEPEVTFEGKLKALLEDFVQEIVEENLANR